jgi:aryl-alcohol dehydrogenase-like predicted oxidoreductase
MGAVAVQRTGQKMDALREAFQFIFDHMDHGVIITGTRSSVHLAESVRAFQGAP